MRKFLLLTAIVFAAIYFGCDAYDMGAGAVRAHAEARLQSIASI